MKTLKSLYSFLLFGQRKMYDVPNLRPAPAYRLYNMQVLVETFDACL